MRAENVMSNRDQAYIMNYASFYGMGSSTECAYITHDNLRRLIQIEVARLKAGDQAADERLTGTCRAPSCFVGQICTVKGGILQIAIVWGIEECIWI